MSVYVSREVVLPDGTSFDYEFCESVNVQSCPELREEILNGKFNTFIDAWTQERIYFETEFFYSDATRGQWFLVRRARESFVRKEGRVVRDSSLFHDLIPAGVEGGVPVLFGISALRETLILQESAYGEMDLRRMKEVLLKEHPLLMRQESPALLHLAELNGNQMSFAAQLRPDTGEFRITVLLDRLESFLGVDQDLRQAVALH